MIPTQQFLAVPSESTTACVPNTVINNRIESEIRPRVEALSAAYDPPLIVVDLKAAYDSLPAATLCTPGSPANYFVDHVHQSAAGYAYMAGLIVAEIEAAPPRPVEEPELPIQTHPVPIAIAPPLLVSAVWLGSRMLRRTRRLDAGDGEGGLA